MKHLTHKARRQKPPAAKPAKHCGGGWRMHRAAGLEILQASALARLPWLVHGFSTRSGGASTLARHPVLNLGYTDWDTRGNVLANRARLLRALDVEGMQVVTLRQFHSDLIHLVSEAAAPAAASLRGDAVLARTPGLLLGMQTADCVPILLVDTAERAVAAVHAGWRGTLRRIAAKALGRMRMVFGTRPENVLAALGPGIGCCCYEVGPEVAQAYSGQFARACEWFDGPFDQLATGAEPPPFPWLSMTPPGHDPPPPRVRLDLVAANCWQLLDAGVLPSNITASPLCTACRADLFFSHRREHGRTGRMLSVIGLRAVGAGQRPCLPTTM